MGTSATAILANVLNDQTTMRPNIDEEDAQRPRYVFNPFRTRKLRPMDMGLLGITALHQGIIQPFFPFDKPDTDFDEVRRTREGDLTVSQGIDSIRLFRRNPKRVVAAIMKQYGSSYDIPTGVMEIEVLRGHDGKLLKELQSVLLPEIYKTASAQISQLQSVNLLGKPALFASVRDVLIQATSASITWAEYHYRKLQRQMQVAANNGGKSLSKLDEMVCRWLEYPIPQVQSKLVQHNAVASVPPAIAPIPTIQCEFCGSFSNLLANGNPPKRCSNAGCGEAFIVVIVGSNGSTDISPSAPFNPDNPFDEVKQVKKK
jgi:hypothetical protein